MAGRFEIPDAARAQPSAGWVVAVGPGRQKACLNCGTPHITAVMPEVGEFVLFPENAGMPQMYEGKEYRILRATDLHGHDPDLRDKMPKAVEQPDAVPQV